MKQLLTLFVFCLTAVYGEYSIVFVHIGNEIPRYAETAVAQARLFNPYARIIFLGNQIGLKRLNPLAEAYEIELCSYDNLKKSAAHQEYEERCVETSPFWRYTSERFLYLYDLMEAYSLENVFHLENDNMLYADLESLLPIFQANYRGVAATFDNEARCIPGFMWIASEEAMRPLARYFAKKTSERLNDMQVIGSYWQKYPSSLISPLPIIMPAYASVYPLESPSHHRTTQPEKYSLNANTFQAIFDAAAIGQYLGGIDPIHANNQPGFINESCLFNPSFLEYQWVLDDEGRKVPYAFFKGQGYKIINLHIHSKRLNAFAS